MKKIHECRVFIDERKKENDVTVINDAISSQKKLN